MTGLIQDWRYATRMLAKTPGFTAVAVLTLALGLTVSAAVFFFVSSFFLRPLPAADPEQLVVIAQRSPDFAMPFPFSYPDLADFRMAIDGPGDRVQSVAAALTDVMAYKEEPVHLSRSGAAAERGWVHAVSDNYFEVLGARAFRGRLFVPGEGQRPGADPILILTHDAWRTRFGADPTVVGQQVKLNGLPFTIVGITPPGFAGATWGAALCGFMPATMLPELSPAHGRMIFNRGDTGFFLMGRLRPGAGLDQARAAIDVVMARLLEDHPGSFAPHVKAVVMPERLSRPSPFVASFVPLVVSTLMAMALLVLAVALANVVNLIFTRAACRERELAIRGAMGASRIRLVRQLLIESVVLALGAGMVGALVSYWLSPWLGSLGPGEKMAPPGCAGPDWRLFAFTFGLSLVAGILAGLFPALRASRADALPLLKDGAPGLSGPRHPLRSLLVAVQVAVSCVVLVGGGLALRSLQALSTVDLDFEPKGLLLASFDLGLQRYDAERCRQFRARLLEEVRGLPGVRDAGLADHAPFDVGGRMRSGISAEGRPAPDDARSQFVPWLTVDDAFLRTLGVAPRAGRDLSPRDDEAAQRVVVVNRILAQQLWPDESAVGRHLISDGTSYRVVGVIGDGPYWAITDRTRGLAFQALAQNERRELTLAVRADGDPVRLVPALRSIVRELDPDLPLFDVRSMEQQVAGSPLALMPLRIGSVIAGAQGMIALLLASLGIFGLVSFSVARRRREIGVRVALGATARDVIRTVSRGAIRLAGTGLAFGLLASLALAPLLAHLLYGTDPRDVTVFAAVGLLVVGVTAIACWLPARRAARADPIQALRCE